MWNDILGESPKSAIDGVTVKYLESLAPASSAEDLNLATALVESHTVFPTVTDSSERAKLLDNLRHVSCLIPSFWTMGENLRYLDPCSRALQKLVDTSSTGKSLRRAFMDAYRRPLRLVLEYGERDWRQPQSVFPLTESQLGYLQLWLFAMRHFPQLTGTSPHTERGKKKPPPLGPHPKSLQMLARLAVRCGFRTRQALDLERKDPDLQDASQCLERAQLSAHSSQVARIAHALRVARRVARRDAQTTVRSPDPQLSNSAPDAACSRRCGLPTHASHNADRQHLFLPKMMVHHKHAASTSVTSTFIKRDIFLSFFELHKVNVDYIDFEAHEAYPTSPAPESVSTTSPALALNPTVDQSGVRGILASLREHSEGEEDQSLRNAHNVESQSISGQGYQCQIEDTCPHHHEVERLRRESIAIVREKEGKIEKLEREATQFYGQFQTLQEQNGRLQEANEALQRTVTEQREQITIINQQLLSQKLEETMRMLRRAGLEHLKQLEWKNAPPGSGLSSEEPTSPACNLGVVTGAENALGFSVCSLSVRQDQEEFREATSIIAHKLPLSSPTFKVLVGDWLKVLVERHYDAIATAWTAQHCLWCVERVAEDSFRAWHIDSMNQEGKRGTKRQLNPGWTIPRIVKAARKDRGALTGTTAMQNMKKTGEVDIDRERTFEEVEHLFDDVEDNEI